MKQIIGIIVVLVLAPTASADERTRIMALLEGYEWSAADAATQAGPAAEAALLALARDESARGIDRARAMATLSHYPSDAVLDFYRQRLATTADPVGRRRVADALCRGFAGSRPAAVEQSLVPLLRADDPHLRVRVARCLDAERFPNAQSAVDAWRNGSATAWERAATEPGGIQ